MSISLPLDLCCGCGVCAVACSRDAIRIVRSEGGFFVPKIDSSRCVDCGICLRVCTQLDSELAKTEMLPAIIGGSFVHHDSDMLKCASSGGVGWAAAQAMLAQGWHAVGVRYDNKRGIACHFKTDDLATYSATMNSKYLPSYTVEGFSDLFDGKSYIVFGTPCQIDSLRRLITMRHAEDKFILVDFFCHGTPSYWLWDRYLNHHLHPGEILLQAKWRDKSHGWHSFTMCLITSKRTIIHTLRQHDYFLNGFLGNQVLNKPCYSCRFRRTVSSADLRIGDFWGKKYQKNHTGVSGVLAFTKRGQKLLELLNSFGEMQTESIPELIAEQITGNHPLPASRTPMLKGLQDGKSLFYLYWRYNYKMLIKNLIPDRLKQLLKTIVKKHHA